MTKKFAYEDFDPKSATLQKRSINDQIKQSFQKKKQVTMAYNDPSAYIKINNMLKKSQKLYKSKAPSDRSNYDEGQSKISLFVDNPDRKHVKNKRKSENEVQQKLSSERKYVSEHDKSRDQKSKKLRVHKRIHQTCGDASIQNMRNEDILDRSVVNLKINNTCFDEDLRQVKNKTTTALSKRFPKQPGDQPPPIRNCKTAEGGRRNR